MRYSNITSVKGLILSVVMLMTLIATAQGQEAANRYGDCLPC